MSFTSLEVYSGVSVHLRSF
uniref:Uncharacterized protein n=1 Tax=Anguilla anguilla TaxID=7936 RepID=A0A0E9XJZ3_ANGAN